MICHGFKGGIGTASRVSGAAAESACSCRRTTADREPDGRRRAGRREHPGTDIPSRARRTTPIAAGSGIDHRRRRDRRAVAPPPVDRLAQRAGFGIARAGGAASTRAATFSSPSPPATATSPPHDVEGRSPLTIAASRCSRTPTSRALFGAAIEATEEAIVNAIAPPRPSPARTGRRRTSSPTTGSGSSPRPPDTAKPAGAGSAFLSSRATFGAQEGDVPSEQTSPS